MSWIEEVKTNIKGLDLSSRTIRQFSFLISAVALIVAVLMLWKGTAKMNAGYLIGFAVVFMVMGIVFPAILRPIYKVWMGFAFTLGWLMTRIILSIVFYVVITPIGLVMRLAGKDFLSLRIDKRVDSYWI
ncbi:hypothetical protein JXB12_12215, partial [candidate division KSB1 bacterium]|nr:hypothetical protein [candidate division KSB1 bacterium]